MLGEQLSSTQSRSLLSAIDKMREILHGEKVTLPEIVVVGDQSVGKSSVLEAISGIQLPRAQNICTRCPLELRMKITQQEEYATIRSSLDGSKEKRIDDLTKIADEVTEMTWNIAGKGVNVSSNPIYLTVYKQDISYDLTLIDLPGITRNPLPGQSANIHEQTLELINKYIEPSTAIVLHVIPASVDFTTSESMKLAKVYDPQCQRQLIAASKIDKYDKGISEKLQGRGTGTMELQLGCVAVLNRNQDEIDQNISFDEMKQREKQFFKKHYDAFQNLPEEFQGTEQLVRRLANIQQERIRSTFPDIIKKLRKQITIYKAKLKKIPVSLNTELECWAKFQSMINTFREAIHDKVKGEYNQVDSIEFTGLSTTSTHSTEKINSDVNSDFSDNEFDEDLSSNDKSDDDHIAFQIFRFQSKFQKKCHSSFSDFLSPDYHEIALREIDRSAGVSLPNFPSYQIIVGLFRQELQKLPKCCDQLVKGIHGYLSKCLVKLFEKAFGNEYSRLKARLNEVIIKRLDEAKEVLSERVQEILEMERHLFTTNHYYMDTVNKLKAEKNEKKDDSDDNFATMSNEDQAAEDIQFALHAYSKVVEKRVTDIISQLCYYHFITQCALKMDELFSAAIPSSQLIQYMCEPQKQTNLRNQLTNSIKACEEALKIGLQHM